MNQPVLERLSFEIFHDDESILVVFDEVMDGANGRMIQRRCSPCLMLEPLGQPAIARPREQEFQRDEPAELLILRLEDDTHAAFADTLDQFVVEYLLAGGR